MKNKFIELLIVVMAIILAGSLIMSIPVLNLMLQGTFFKEETISKTEVKIKKISVKKELKKKARKLKKPKRSKSKSRSLKSGPRFAMDLGISGMGGVNVPLNLTNTTRGDGSGGGGDVDQRPKSDCPPNFELPDKLRETEQDAKVVISFCVNEVGKVYELSIVEEIPTGQGLAQAAKNAIKSSCFQPAQKDGQALSFCGMEQPFEVRWND